MTDHITTPDYETKAHWPSPDRESAEAFDDLQHTFEVFKETNDLRLAEIEQRMAGDPLTEDKLDRINQAIDEQRRLVDELVMKASRPQLGGSPATSAAAMQHKSAFEGYVRHGQDAGLRALEHKALSGGSDPDGGYLVPQVTETEIMRHVRDISPIRAISGIREVSTTTYRKPFATSGAGAGWVAETGNRLETATPTLAELSYPTMELYAMPAATGALLDDSAVNIDEWIAEEVRIAFAEQEGAAFVTGNGTNKPRGFLDYTKVANGSWTWGNLGYLATGNDGTFDASNPSDDLVDLIYALRSGYRANAHWVMNRSVQAEIRKFKDTEGNYLWQPGAQAGAAPTLMNYPIAESEDMPSIGSNAYAIAFGDFRRGYLVVDRVGIRVLRDPYSSKPYVLFYTTKRVGGGVQDFDAIKLLKFGVS